MDECLHCRIFALIVTEANAEPDIEKHGEIFQNACAAIGQAMGAMITAENFPDWLDFIRQVAEEEAAKYGGSMDDLASRPVAGNA